MIIYAFFRYLLAFKTGKNAVCSLPLAVLIFASSCSSNNAKIKNEVDTDSVKHAIHQDTSNITRSTKKSVFAGEQLPTLYIGNFAGNEQLQKLLLSTLGQGKKQKLIFQLYLDATGILRILVVPAGASNRKYFLADAVEPNVSKQLNPPLGTEDVFLSDLQLTNKASDSGPERGDQRAIDELKAHIYDPEKPDQNKGWQYILFTPVVAPITEGTFIRKYVVYKVTACKDEPREKNKNQFVELTAYSNPSPPRQLE